MAKTIQAVSSLRLVKWCAQWQDKDNWEKIPLNLRGIYVLYMRRKRSSHYDVVYVGMAASGVGIKRRLRSHARSKTKKGKWSHFSFFVVWENIREDEIRELEALFREIYRKDSKANSLNKQKRSKSLQRVRRKEIADWHEG
jgi:hypothetical protein